MNENTLVFTTNNLVLFPNSEIRFELDNDYDKEFFYRVNDTYNKELLIVNPYDNNRLPDVTMLPSIGILAKLSMIIDMPNGKCKLTIVGLDRVKVNDYVIVDDYYTARYDFIDNSKIVDDNYKNILIKALNNYVNKVPYVSNSVMSKIDLVDNLNDLTDLIVSFLPLSLDKKVPYVQELDSHKRCKMLLEDINNDISFVELEEQIEREVEKELDESQKEYYLRQKISVIQKELGDTSNKDNELAMLQKKFKSLKCPKKIKDRIKEEINRYETTPSNSPEVSVIRDYLDWMLNLPWNTYTKDNKDFHDVVNILDESHYGLSEVKERILEYLAVKQNTNSLKSPIICLVGPPGVGKTTLALSIAKALSRKVTKISVGGINDEAEIVGHRRTYIASSPGRIVEGLKRAGSMNPVFIIDEIDKMTKDIKGDPASSLLEVLDPSQNSHFTDHYIDEEVDLSRVMFIATANYIDQIPYELLDRLEIIEVPSYTEYEKFEISKNYIIPKALEEVGLTMFNVNFTDDAIMDIIRYYTKEAGVRELERKISAILRKIVKKFVFNKNEVSYEVDSSMVLELLGNKKYFYNSIKNKKRVGVVNGLAYTAFGGDILPIEATYYKGKGNLILTGNLGDVMKESFHISYSYVKAHAKEFNIDIKLLENNDIHIHVPEGAINKDGPSAGITIVTVIISLFKNYPVKSSIAMTGEMTLSGKVLPIGGLREKTIGAHRANIKTIYLPYDNKKDIEDIDIKIRKDIKFVFVDNYMDMYNKIFEEETVLKN